MAHKIVDAAAWAADDPYRAVTHNKGIMNGIDAVALACGQDWRAIEAAAHGHAASKGQYTALSSYSIRIDEKTNEKVLEGRLELPLAVGTRGGSIQSNPTMLYTHSLLGNPTSQELAEIITAVGLAQNFAALRALVSEGLQRGHMRCKSTFISI
jgi:degradative hydroxymethylglutaryl-CoA reductase